MLAQPGPTFLITGLSCNHANKSTMKTLPRHAWTASRCREGLKCPPPCVLGLPSRPLTVSCYAHVLPCPLPHGLPLFNHSK